MAPIEPNKKINDISHFGRIPSHVDTAPAQHSEKAPVLIDPKAIPALPKDDRVATGVFLDRNTDKFFKTNSLALISHCLHSQSASDEDLGQVINRAAGEIFISRIDMADEIGRVNVAFDPKAPISDRDLRLIIYQLHSGDKAESDNAKAFLLELARQGHPDAEALLTLLGTVDTAENTDALRTIADDDLVPESLKSLAKSFVFETDKTVVELLRATQQETETPRNEIDTVEKKSITENQEADGASTVGFAAVSQDQVSFVSNEADETRLGENLTSTAAQTVFASTEGTPLKARDIEKIIEKTVAGTGSPLEIVVVKAAKAVSQLALPLDQKTLTTAILAPAWPYLTGNQFGASLAQARTVSQNIIHFAAEQNPNAQITLGQNPAKVPSAAAASLTSTPVITPSKNDGLETVVPQVANPNTFIHLLVSAFSAQASQGNLDTVASLPHLGINPSSVLGTQIASFAAMQGAPRNPIALAFNSTGLKSSTIDRARVESISPRKGHGDQQQGQEGNGQEDNSQNQSTYIVQGEDDASNLPTVFA